MKEIMRERKNILIVYLFVYFFLYLFKSRRQQLQKQLSPMRLILEHRLMTIPLAQKKSITNLI